MHVVGIILFVWLLRVLLLVGRVVVALVVVRAMLGVIRDLCTAAPESIVRVWNLTTESNVVCKVRAWKIWDLVFCEPLWRVLGYVVVVTLGLVVGGAAVGALVLRYAEAGIGELALQLSCRPLLLVTLLSAIGNQCVHAPPLVVALAWNVRSPRTQVLDYASSCARPLKLRLNGAKSAILPGCRQTAATRSRTDVPVVA